MTPAEIEAAFEHIESQAKGSTRHVWRMFTYIGDEGLVEYEPRVRSLLTHDDYLVRGTAVATLSSQWRLASFRDECRAVALDDEHPDVRTKALRGLTSYALGSGDIEVARFFYTFLQDESKPFAERSHGVLAIPRVLDATLNTQEFFKIRAQLMRFDGTDEEFDQLVPWAQLDELMQRYS